MSLEATISKHFENNDLAALRSLVASGSLVDHLKAFHRVIGGERSKLTHEQFKATQSRDDRLAGVVIVARYLQMPFWNAFGPLQLFNGEAESDYDRARTFIVSKKRISSVHPSPGPFYPEVMHLSSVDRIIRLADSVVGCDPAGNKLANLYSLRARLTLSDAKKAAMPFGTTCALFLRAVLVAAGDCRFTANTDKLTIEKPGLGNTAYGLGANYHQGTASGPGLKTSDQPGQEPIGIRRGDLYYVDSSGNSYYESGHVGLIADVISKGGGTVEVITIDGGQKKGDGLYAQGKGWWIKKKFGQIKFVKATKQWEKLIKDDKGVIVRFPAKVTKYDNKGKAIDSKFEFREFRHWVSIRDVGAFEQLLTQSQAV